MLKKFATTLLVIAALSSVASSAIIGTNEYLEAHNGKAFTPQKESTSGTLGDFNGNRIVGAKSDTITLSKGQSSIGYVTYTLEFDLTQEFGGLEFTPTSENLDAEAGMILTLALYNIDFLPVTGQGRIYMETMDLVFRADSYDGDKSSLLLNAENYMDYRTDEVTKTANTNATYLIDMLSMITTEEIDAMLSDMKFYLDITLTSYTERTAAGTGTYVNTKQFLGNYSANGFGGDEFTNGNEVDIPLLVPEPMTVSLLAMGSLVLIRRRKA